MPEPSWSQARLEVNEPYATTRNYDTYDWGIRFRDLEELGLSPDEPTVHSARGAGNIQLGGLSNCTCLPEEEWLGAKTLNSGKRSAIANLKRCALGILEREM